jgi:hypothetical protein
VNARRAACLLGVLVLVAAAPAPAFAQSSGGGGGDCFLRICDAEAWLRDVVNHIVAGFLGGLISGIGGAITSFPNDIDFLLRTPEALSYRNDTVMQFATASQMLANGLLAVITLIGGFNVLLRPYLGSSYASALEVLPRLLLGAILINTARWWTQLAIDVNNAFSAVFGAGPPPNFADALARSMLPTELLIGLIYVVMGLLQVLALRLGFNLATGMPPATGAGLIQPLLGIAVLAVVLKIPGLMRGGGGGGTLIGSLIGSAAGAVVGGGAGRLALGALGGRAAAGGAAGAAGATRTAAAAQYSLPITVGVPAGRGAEQLSLPIAVPQPARGA